MKTAALCLLLVACGGPPFEVGSQQLYDVRPDAQAADSAPAADQDAAGEGSAPEDGGGGQDAACALLPTAQGQRAYGCAPYAHPDGAPIDGPIPATFAWQTGSTCGIAPTPAECQCAAAYNCACLRAAGVCATITGTAWVGCNDQASNMPTVTCE